MRIVASIEKPWLVRAVLEHRSLRDEPQPPPVLLADRRAPVEIEYLSGVK